MCTKMANRTINNSNCGDPGSEKYQDPSETKKKKQNKIKTKKNEKLKIQLDCRSCTERSFAIANYDVQRCDRDQKTFREDEKKYEK